MIFRDRVDAGQKLAEKLTEYARRDDVLILALPRGGVPVAFEVAERLNAPMDVFLVRKLGVPGQEELAMGAIALGGVRVLKQMNPTKIVVAVPVASDETCREFQQEVDAVVCAITPEPFYGVGLWYDDFSQTTDEEVRELLKKSEQKFQTSASVKRA